ncbi:MAG: hypothetical protein ABDH32_06115 [Candidatus Caldarchaeales archaeon]
MSRISYLLIFILFISILLSSTDVYSARREDMPKIVVYVFDQYNHRYDGVYVSLWMNDLQLVDTGTTTNGVWISKKLSENQNYTIIISSPVETKNITVTVTDHDIIVNATITRPISSDLSVILLEQNPYPAYPGNIFNITIKITNDGILPVYDATLTFYQNPPFTIIKCERNCEIKVIDPGQSVLAYVTLSTDPISNPGQYAIPFTLRYSDPGLGSSIATVRGNIWVTLSGKPYGPDLVIVDVSMSPKPAVAGNELNIKLNVKNIGRGVAYGSTIQLNTTFLLPYFTITGPMTILLGDILEGQSVQAEFNLSIDYRISPNIYDLPIILKFRSETGPVVTKMDKLLVDVRNIASVKIAAILFDRYPIRAGTELFLKVNLMNVGKEDAFDVELEIDELSGIVNSRKNYLGLIPSGKVLNSSFYIVIPQNVTDNILNLLLKLRYRDSRGNEYVNETMIEVPIEGYSPPKVVVSSVLFDPPVIAKGSTGTFTIFIKNVGVTPAYDVNVRILDVGRGSGILTSNSFYIGVMNPGESTTQVVGVNVDPYVEEGRRLLHLIIEYSDPLGSRFTNLAYAEISIVPSILALTSEQILLLIIVIIGISIMVFIISRRRHLVHEKK